jgi:hypothetical protein
MQYRAALVLIVGCGNSPSNHVDAPPSGDDASAVDAPKDTGTYAAYATIGGLDHLRIAKTVNGTCFAIDLASPGSNTMGLTLPSTWGFMAARAMQPEATCNPAYAGPITHTFDATSQSGTIAWQGSGTPTTIQTVAVALNFASPPSWCPASQTLSASGIAVH